MHSFEIIHAFLPSRNVANYYQPLSCSSSMLQAVQFLDEKLKFLYHLNSSCTIVQPLHRCGKCSPKTVTNCSVLASREGESSSSVFLASSSTKKRKKDKKNLQTVAAESLINALRVWDLSLKSPFKSLPLCHTIPSWIRHISPTRKTHGGEHQTCGIWKDEGK